MNTRTSQSFHRSGAALAVLMLALAGCNNPKTAGKNSFKDALQAWFNANPECVNIGRIPAELRMDDPQARRAGYDALTAASLLSVES